MHSNILTLEDLYALEEFRRQYPRWWYRIGVCDQSYDFTAAPQADAPEIKHVEINNVWDRGFDCMHPTSLAKAIWQVMEDIESEVI